MSPGGCPVAFDAGAQQPEVQRADPSRELLAEADRGGPGRRTRNGSERTGCLAQFGQVQCGMEEFQGVAPSGI